MIIQTRLLTEQLSWVFALNSEAVERPVFVGFNGRSGSLADDRVADGTRQRNTKERAAL
jgi:hypothetical protein